MRKYEATYILDPNLGDEVVTGMVEKFSQSVVGQGGEVADVKNWGKRRLAYEIKGRGEGVYVTMRFDSETTVAAELRRQLGLADEVLRSLIVHLN
jgi:small subunit ribosomal protein S6